MEDAMAEVATRAQAEGDLSPQVCVVVCVRAFGTEVPISGVPSSVATAREGKRVAVLYPVLYCISSRETPPYSDPSI